jgi:predicted MFS family arabinose efflux permease
VCIFLGVISLVLINISGNTQFVYPFIFFFGSGWGVTAPMFMSSAADLFKGKSFGLIYGILEGVIGIGGALGAWLPGFIFDRTQSYLGAFYAASLIILISCLFIWLAAPRKVNNKI